MPDAAPLHAQVTGDSERTAAATIGPEGGSLSTTDAAGIEYTLTLPDGAMPTTTLVSMTPISEANGLPFAGPIAGGVMFEPEGLVLESVATLQVTGLPETDVQAFGFHGDGIDLYRWMTLPEEGVVIPVVHFSGTGVATDTSGPSDWRPADPLSRYVHDHADALAEAVSTGDATEFYDLAADALLETRAQLLGSALQGALADPLGQGDALIRSLISIERQLQLIGKSEAEGSFDQQTLDAIISILNAMASALSERCRSQSHDPIGTFLRGVALVRQTMLLGIAIADTELRDRLSGLSECTRYRIFVDPTMEMLVQERFYVTDGDRQDVEATFVTGRQQVHLEYRDNRLRWHAELPVQVRSENWTDECWSGRPFQLFGRGGPGTPALLDVTIEPTIRLIRQPSREPGRLFRLVPADDQAQTLTVTLRLNGVALMPTGGDGCSGDPQFLDVGGAWLGAGGGIPFEIPVAGTQYSQTAEGRTFIQPPDVETPLEHHDHAVITGTHFFTTDREGPPVDLEILFAGQ